MLLYIIYLRAGAHIALYSSSQRAQGEGKYMNDYVAWLGGASVARGTLTEVERKAREVFATPLYQEFAKAETTLRITRGTRQLFVKSIVLTKEGAR